MYHLLRPSCIAGAYAKSEDTSKSEGEEARKEDLEERFWWLQGRFSVHKVDVIESIIMKHLPAAPFETSPKPRWKAVSRRDIPKLIFVSHSPQEFISNCPTLCACQILAMVLISLSTKSLPGHQANPSTHLWSLSRESASCIACFLSFVAAFASIHSSLSREFDEKGPALSGFIFLISHTRR
jgi:hypothetical protein